MFIGEHTDGGITEIESRDMTFLENDFPTIGEIDHDYTLYEMEEPIGSIIPIREDQGFFVDPSPSGSNPLRNKVLPEQP